MSVYGVEKVGFVFEIVASPAQPLGSQALQAPKGFLPSSSNLSPPSSAGSERQRVVRLGGQRPLPPSSKMAASSATGTVT